jgi:hypothetical protein
LATVSQTFSDATALRPGVHSLRTRGKADKEACGYSKRLLTVGPGDWLFPRVAVIGRFSLNWFAYGTCTRTNSKPSGLLPVATKPSARWIGRPRRSAHGTWPRASASAQHYPLQRFSDGYPLGPELLMLYNDGYWLLQLRNIRRPWSATRHCWPEIWHINEPILRPYSRKLGIPKSTFPITCNGYLEEAYFTPPIVLSGPKEESARPPRFRTTSWS